MSFLFLQRETGDAPSPFFSRPLELAECSAAEASGAGEEEEEGPAPSDNVAPEKEREKKKEAMMQ